MDSDLWSVCAGPFAVLPPINSIVVYFPQGHFHHNNFPCPSLPQVRPFIHCRVSAVQLCADPTTDEVFAKISLVPIPTPTTNCNQFDTNGGGTSNQVDGCGGVKKERNPNDIVWCAKVLTQSDANTGTNNQVDGCDGLKEEERNPNNIVWCAKVLTQSDANTGGGFSVPKICADLIFPPLNFEEDPPVQEIHPKDIHGGVWKFRHIYRGMPRRHLLTSGWSIFVNRKNLVAGDALIFMRKNGSPSIGVGIRRNRKEVSEELRRMSSEEVAAAATLAAEGKPFEVVYEPCRSTTQFLVNPDVASQGVNSAAWMREGTRVSVEVENKTYFYKNDIRTGVVVKLQEQDPNSNWPDSPWRIVQVKLDEKEGEEEGENVCYISPWLVTVESEFELPEFNHCQEEETLPLAAVAAEEPNPGSSDHNVTASKSDVTVTESQKTDNESDVTATESEKTDDKTANSTKKIKLFGKYIEVTVLVDKTESPSPISLPRSPPMTHHLRLQ